MAGGKMLGVDVTKIYTVAQISDGRSDAGLLGEEWFDERSGKKYKFVKATGAITKGNILQFDTAGANEPNSVKETSAVAQLIAGIAQTALESNPANTDSFWMQIGGESPGINLTTGIVAGDILGSSATAGRLAKLDSAGANPTQAEHRAALAVIAGRSIFALDNEAANAGEVFIK